MSRARGAPSLGSLVEVYIAEREARHEYTALSVRNARCSLANFARAMGDRPVAKLARADIEEWLATRHRLAAATRRHNLSNVRSFCQWLVRRGHLPADPTAELAPVRVPRYLPRAIGAPKVAKLLEVGLDLTRFARQGWCVDHAARAAVSWWMVASYSAGLR